MGLFLRIFTFLALAGIASFSSACPTIGGLIDYNCDKQIKIAITGDSIVRGIGDVDYESEGYVERLRTSLPEATIENLGVAGITSSRLYRSFKKLLQNPDGETSLKSKDADLFIIEVGPNDYWQEENPALTVRNIYRLVKLLRSSIGTDVQTAPKFVIATLLPTKRAYQAPFIKQVNALLLARNSEKFSVKIRFDKVSANLLSEDGLHPAPEGYDAMELLVRRYIKRDLQRIYRKERKDADSDGVFDYFETVRYGTDPANPDSDFDGVSDGTEIFTNLTNPLAAPIPTPTATPAP